MNILDVEQHTDKWLKMRQGHLTASRIFNLRDRERGKGELAGRKKLRYELLAEIVTERLMSHYVSPAMEWGIEQEPNAKKEYEFRTDCDLRNIGFVLHNTLPRCGASPDAWVYPNGLAEFKCPNTETHLEYLDGGVVPEKYMPQLIWQMACCGPEIEWVDFVSYDPRVDEALQMFIVRVERNDEQIKEWEERAEKFIIELDGAAKRTLDNAKFVTREEKLRESVRRAKGYPYSDAALMEQLRDEGIQVP